MRFLLILLYFVLSSFVFSKDFKINKINFYGLKYFSQESIISKININSKLNGIELFEHLVELQIFDHIKIELNNDELNINVIEKPFIQYIKIYGEKNNSQLKSLLTDFKIKSGELYDDALLNLFKIKIEEYYLNKGFYNCKTDIKVILNKKKNSVVININILKNNFLKINDIFITGNAFYNKNSILSLLSISKHNWISWFAKNDIYFRGKLISDLRKIRSFYLNNGYIDFQINFVKIYLSKNKKSVLILIDLFEGDEHEFGNINVEGNCSEEIKSKLKNLIFPFMKKNSLFSFANLMKARKKLSDIFYDNGFANTIIDFNILNSGEKAVDVIFSLNIASKIMVKKISFIGNNITSDNVLRNFLSQFEETYLSLDDINFSKQEIIRHGLASNVDVTFIKSSDYNDSIDLIYKIKEQGTNKFMAGCSYLQGDNFIFHINSDLLNFFGTGKDLSINISKSKMHSDYSFNYLNSRFLDSNFDISYNIYFKTENFNKDILYFDHASDILGASILYQANIGKYKNFNIGFGYDRTKLKLTEDRAPLEIKSFIYKEGIKYREYYLTINYIYNSLDKPVFPNDGYMRHLNLRISLPNSDLKYYYMNYDVNYYKRIYNNYILGIYYTLCYGNKYANTTAFPFFKNFFLKGASNVRGFKDRTLGPKDSNNESVGGNILFCVKFSTYFPLPLLSEFETVRTSIFFDVGQVYNTNKYLDKLNIHNRFLKYNSFFRFSFGLAVAWNSPFGVPVDLSIAYPLNADPTDRKKVISFSMGM